MFIDLVLFLPQNAYNVAWDSLKEKIKSKPNITTLSQYYSKLKDAIEGDTPSSDNQNDKTIEELQNFMTQDKKYYKNWDAYTEECHANKNNIEKAIKTIREIQKKGVSFDNIEYDQTLLTLHEIAIRFPGFGILPSIVMYHDYLCITAFYRRAEKDFPIKIPHSDVMNIVKEKPNFLYYYQDPLKADKDNDHIRNWTDYHNSSIRSRIQKDLSIQLNLKDQEEKKNFYRLCEVIDLLQHELFTKRSSQKSMNKTLKHNFFLLLQEPLYDFFEIRKNIVYGTLSENEMPHILIRIFIYYILNYADDEVVMQYIYLRKRIQNLLEEIFVCLYAVVDDDMIPLMKNYFYALLEEKIQQNANSPSFDYTSHQKNNLFSNVLFVMLKKELLLYADYLLDYKEHLKHLSKIILISNPADRSKIISTINEDMFSQLKQLSSSLNVSTKKELIAYCQCVLESVAIELVSIIEKDYHPSAAHLELFQSGINEKLMKFLSIELAAFFIRHEQREPLSDKVMIEVLKSVMNRLRYNDEEIFSIYTTPLLHSITGEKKEAYQEIYNKSSLLTYSFKDINKLLKENQTIVKKFFNNYQKKIKTTQLYEGSRKRDNLFVKAKQVWNSMLDFSTQGKYNKSTFLDCILLMEIIAFDKDVFEYIPARKFSKQRRESRKLNTVITKRSAPYNIKDIKFLHYVIDKRRTICHVGYETETLIDSCRDALLTCFIKAINQCSNWNECSFTMKSLVSHTQDIYADVFKANPQTPFEDGSGGHYLFDSWIAARKEEFTMSNSEDNIFLITSGDFRSETK